MVRRLPSVWFDEHESSYRASGEQFNVNPRIVEAMINVETGGNARAVGDGGRSHGILQILDGTDTHINRVYRGPFLDRRDPEDAFRMACVLLNDLRTNFIRGDENYVTMLRCYNAGPGGQRGQFTMDYAAYAAAYLAMRAEDTRTDPARAGEHREYVQALNTMLEDADDLGRGAEFRRMVTARVSAESRSLRGYGLGYYNAHDVRESGRGWREFRDGAIGFLDGAANSPERQEHLGITRDRDLVRRVQQVLGEDVDGVWGRDTQRAFVASGRDTNNDGNISRAELDALLSNTQLPPLLRPAPGPTPATREEHAAITRYDANRNSQQREQIRVIQRALGFTGDAVDGIWGTNTQRAFREYESCHMGFNADGLITRAELATLTAPPTPPRAPEERGPLQALASMFGFNR